MKIPTFQRTLIVATLASTLSVGCSSNNNDDATNSPSNNAQNLLGSVMKGPIDQATVIIKDANGREVARTRSTQGKFTLPAFSLSSEYYTVETEGGQYLDEATGQTVNLTSGQGLKSLYSQSELREMMGNQTYAALTPETTIYTNLIKTKLAEGKPLDTAMTEAETVITNTLIKNTSPLGMLSGDKFIKTGDLTKPIPSNQSEAFARNRSISYSYLARDLGKQPKDAFTIVDAVSTDLEDGQLDNDDLNNDGKKGDVKEGYGLARTKLFNDTTTKLQKGELSDAQKQELKLMGLDVDNYQNALQTENSALQQKVSQYLASSTLPTLRTLPVLTDEDGDSTNAAATYTLTANTNITVPIETPEGTFNTTMWRYNGNPLPIAIKANRNDQMTLNFKNRLNADSTIHWHGFKIPANMDGGPETAISAGKDFTYRFKMQQPAAPLWFHPHPDMETGKQVYMGLAGVFLLEDDISKQLEANNQLPTGDKDVVLLVQDRRFDAEKTDSDGDKVRDLLYKNKPMDSDGMLGDQILVNGSVMPKLSVSNTQYRFRLYNVSNARTYDFALSDGKPFKVIATDGGLLDEPVEVTHITLGAAERVEIVVDFSQYSTGDKVLLVSQPFNGDMMGMMGNMNGMGSGSGMNGSGMNGSGMNGSGMNGSGMNGSGMNGSGMNSDMPEMGAGLTIMRFDIDRSETDPITLYTSLPDGAEIKTRWLSSDATNPTTRQFVMSMPMGNMANMNGSNSNGMNGMTFVINGKTFDINRVDEFIEAGATEVWEISNRSPMAHPFHAHAIQYQILSRNGQPATGVDLGWKDTFLVQPGERVKVIAKFDPEINNGDYMYHCHILEHEDAGMMGYFRIGESGQLGDQTAQ